LRDVGGARADLGQLDAEAGQFAHGDGGPARCVIPAGRGAVAGGAYVAFGVVGIRQLLLRPLDRGPALPGVVRRRQSLGHAPPRFADRLLRSRQRAIGLTDRAFGSLRLPMDAAQLGRRAADAQIRIAVHVGEDAGDLGRE
jgi:hypothetical protein